MEKFNMQAQSNQRAQDLKYYEGLANSWETGIGSTLDKLKSFTKYVPLSEFPKLFVKYELFKKVLGVHGAIIECGVHQGGGLLTWGMLSSIFEPVNHIRKIVGFDSFEGFTSIHEKDKALQNANLKVGGLAVDAEDDIRKSIELFDQFRPLGHIPKIQLVRGNAISTIPDFVKNTPQLVVAMLYLDFDVYEPTKVALQEFLPRMPKGSIIVFDELYNDQWPGETQAVVDTIGIQQLKLERFPFHPQISYAVL
jgi:hypothetical protein